jgi:uncharacterized protein (TIGR02145 family)
VPTDAEWGDILNAMESGAKTNHNQKVGFCGSDAALHGKAVCTLAQGATPDDIEAAWAYDARATGIDTYELRILPAGLRYYDGSSFYGRYAEGYFWSSSAYDGSYAWVRQFSYAYATVARAPIDRSYSYPVRCIRD